MEVSSTSELSLDDSSATITQDDQCKPASVGFSDSRKVLQFYFFLYPIHFTYSVSPPYNIRHIRYPIQ